MSVEATSEKKAHGERSLWPHGSPAEIESVMADARKLAEQMDKNANPETMIMLINYNQRQIAICQQWVIAGMLHLNEILRRQAEAAKERQPQENTEVSHAHSKNPTAPSVGATTETAGPA